MRISIEDNFEDVLMKASVGLGLGKHELADCSGLSVEAVEALLAGEPDESDLRTVAPVLRLDEVALVEMATKGWYPKMIELDGLKGYNTSFPLPGYDAMTVNSYLIWNSQTKVALAFDTGANVQEMLADIELKHLDLQGLVITHIHRDHIAALDELLSCIEGQVVFAPKLEPVKGARLLKHLDRFEVDGLSIEARFTNGHSPGGMSYVVQGLQKPVAVVGDSLFCLSQGGVRQDNYVRALQNNREQILSLPDATILCPGHGPMTTVANEKAHNPFFPEYK